ncbi:hypothetical protein EOD39_3876, partial [Acipenser ruthenus]
RSKKSASEDNSADDDGDSKLTEDVKKKEKHSVLPLINKDPSHSLSKNSSAEDPTLQPVSSSLGDHAQTSQIDEYKYAAPTLLEELGEMLLEYEGCEEVNFPRGLLNILNCSWKELVEGAVYSKRQQQSLACKSMKHLKLRSSVHSEKFSEDVADKQLHGKSKPKKRVTRAENTIERGMSVHFKQETKGQKRWIVQQEESKPQDPEWKALCAWAVERLRLAQVPINEQTSNLKEAGFSKPVILRHYGDAKNKAFAKYKKQGKAFSYPSGRIAVCQSYSGLPCGGFYTNVFSDSSDPYTLATFTPFGHASVCHPGRWQQESVQVSLSPLTNVIPPGPDELGFILTGEKLSSKASKELSKANRKKMMEIEARKKFMAKKSEATKSSNEFSKLVKMLEIPEEGPSHVRGVEAAQELRKLQRKIKNILDDWMEHYRIATGKPEQIVLLYSVSHLLSDFVLGISSPDISKMSSTPQRTILKRKTKSAASPSLVPIDVEWKETDAVQPQSNNPEASPFRFLSAPARNILWDPPKSSQSSRSMMMGEGEKKRCRCSNHQTPCLTDLEYDAFITGQMPGIEQIVVCRLDSFRLVKYDIATAGTQTVPQGSLLLQRHNVAPGMFLVSAGVEIQFLQFTNSFPHLYLQMYICGKLLFADYIFNGYSSSIKDLQKQISITRGNYRMGLSLPSDFRFRYSLAFLHMTCIIYLCIYLLI